MLEITQKFVDLRAPLHVSSINNTVYEPKPNEAKLPTWMQRLQQFLGWNDVFKSPKCEEPKIPTMITTNKNISENRGARLMKNKSYKGV